MTYRHDGRDLTYIDPNDPENYDALSGAYTPKDYTLLQKIERHVIIGTELLLSKNFHLRASYNFQRRQNCWSIHDRVPSVFHSESD
jgi:hypothetical protein